MKIGIMTYWSSDDNYGQLLQCFALQKFLLKCGHEPCLIKYKETVEYENKRTISIAKIARYFTHFNQYFAYFKEVLNRKKYANSNCNEMRDFDGFREKYITSTNSIYSEEELINRTPRFDAYICGSDQIWGGVKEYYLSFLSQDKIKIAYAPSFGGVNPFCSPECVRIKKYLAEFNFLSAREKSGVEILHQAGFKSACQVVDPTLLLSASDYISLVENKEETAKQGSTDAFLYFLGNSMACDMKDIVKFLLKYKMSYTYVSSQGRYDKLPKSYLTIPDWIDGIRNSKFVITNSFHCVVFALIFHRPFLFIPLVGGYGRMNDRLLDILKKCNLLDRIFNGNLSKVFEPIDFDSFDTLYSEEIERSKSRLIEALKH